MVVNDLLMHVEPLQPIWLPVNKHGRQTAAYARRYDEAFAVDLPILNEIDQTVRVGTSGSYMTAVQAAVKLLDWGVDTGLDPEEIRAATAAWLGNMGNDAQTAFADKLALVDNAYQSLLKDGAEDLLSSAGCTDTAYPWSTEPVESIEAIMEAAGLRA